MKRLPWLLGASGVSLALFTVSCTTLGTHVKGGFSCAAPKGVCAPMSNIDAQAVAGLGASTGQAMPISGEGGDGQPRFITTSATGVPVRTGEHVMRVVFPAHTDGGGVYHEEAVAHLVTDRSVWAFRQEEAPTAGSLDAAIQSDSPGARPAPGPAVAATEPVGPTASAAPLNLREAAAGLVAPASPMPDSPPEQVAVDIGGPQPGLPTAAALAAAHAGHRIGDTSTGAAIAANSVRHGVEQKGERQNHRTARAPTPATVPGAATAALNRAALSKLKPVAALAPSTADPAPSGHQLASAQVHP